MGSSFELDIARFKIKTERAIEQFVQKIVLDMHANLIVLKWPVKSGRSRANNMISLNSLPSESIMELDPSGQATISKGMEVMARFKLGDTIFLYNNVAYAIALEFGHSKQAPAGVYRIAVQDVLGKYGK